MGEPNARSARCLYPMGFRAFTSAATSTTSAVSDAVCVSILSYHQGVQISPSWSGEAQSCVSTASPSGAQTVALNSQEGLDIGEIVYGDSQSEESQGEEEEGDGKGKKWSG